MEGAAAPLRVIFLDIDGVICCNSMGRLEDKKLRILQGVAQTAQAKIVWAVRVRLESLIER